MKTFYLFAFLLLTGFACCPPLEPKKKEIKVNDYIVKDYELMYHPSTWDSTTQLMNIPSHSVQINEFEKHPFRDQILKTTDFKWLELIQSKDPEVAHSACLWLHYLKDEPVTLLEYYYISQKSTKYKEFELNYWRNTLKLTFKKLTIHPRRMSGLIFTCREY